MKVTKLRKKSKDKILEEVERSIDEINDIFVLVSNNDGTFSWWTSGMSSMIWTIGALEFLKNVLINDKGSPII